MSKKRKNDAWKELENRIAEKKGGDKRKEVVPQDIMVQRMAPTPSGRLKKFEPLEPREFVPFSGFSSLSIENIKMACERHFNMPEKSCDVLASNQGPSCSRDDQIKGKKCYLIRFLSNDHFHAGLQNDQFQAGSSTSILDLETRSEEEIRKKVVRSVFAKSVSVADLLKAGRVIKEKVPELLCLERFDITDMTWKKHGTMNITTTDKHFEEGAFRKAFKIFDEAGNTWVMKRYKAKAIKQLEDLDLTHEEHARKQVQMHAVARNLAQRMAKAAPSEFGQTFKYYNIYYSLYKDEPVTIEEFVDGQFVKYINNDGKCKSIDDENLTTVYRKAETLVHYSYVVTEYKLMLVDIQGAMYQLYDPEIATTELFHQGELYFCSGNLSTNAIHNFLDTHECSGYCGMLGLKDLVKPGAENTKDNKSDDIETVDT